MVSLKVYELSGGVYCALGFRNEPKLQSVCVCETRQACRHRSAIIAVLPLPTSFLHTIFIVRREKLAAHPLSHLKKLLFLSGDSAR